MKKRIYIILLSLTVIFFSCRDDSGAFEEQLFTPVQMSTAIKQCITLCSDSTLNVLCIVDTLNQKYGYYYYYTIDDGDTMRYRITLPGAAKQVVDTLRAYDFGDEIDALILDINRAAEQCGNKIKSDFFTTLDKEITFPDPYSLIHNENYTAITNYVKSIKQLDFITALTNSILYDLFDDFNINGRWEQLLKEYANITDKLVFVELLPDAAKKMVDGFFTIMGYWEEAVRKDPELRGDKNSMLYLVFAEI